MYTFLVVCGNGICTGKATDDGSRTLYLQHIPARPGTSRDRVQQYLGSYIPSPRRTVPSLICVFVVSRLLTHILSRSQNVMCLLVLLRIRRCMMQVRK
jgi:hypothetical protein